MEYREFGTTGRSLSVIGFGGIAVMDETPAAAATIVAQAIERGVTYFDVAPSYGNAEERLGPALAPYRDDVFLACKTAKRSGPEAAAELASSLQRLQTDRLDLYQLHAVTTQAEVDQVLAPGGALEVVVAARERGQVAHIGFSAHSESAALQLLDAYPFDSILLPINFACWEHGHFGPATFAKAEAMGVALLALKVLAKRPWAEGEVRSYPKCWYCPIDTLAEARQALAFALSKPVTATVSPSHAELLWLACDALDSLATDPLPATAALPEGAPIFSTPQP